MNCANSVENAWLTPHEGGTIGGDWFEWRLESDDPGYTTPLVPNRLDITPRAGMTDPWYEAHNPSYLRVVGILPDGSYDDGHPVLILDPITPRWDDGSMRQFAINSVTEYIGFRAYVRSWNSMNVDITDNHTGWGELKMFGSIAGDIPEAVNPDGSPMLNPDGSNAVNPGGF
jgi:hypothetical protein